MCAPRPLLALLILGAAPAVAHAGAPLSLHDALSAPKALTLSGTARVRYEAIDGQPRPALREPNDVVVLRSTLLMEYRTDAFRIGGELWDSRAYGGHRGGGLGVGDVNAAELTQAYVAAKFAGHAELQAGRFVMNLGSRRLIAADDYRNTTNGFTGFRLTGKYGPTAVEAIYVMPHTRLPDTEDAILHNRVRWDRESTDLMLWGGALARNGLPGGLSFDGSLLGLDEHDGPGRPTRDRALRTATGRLLTAPAPGKFDFEAEYSYQFGHIRAGTQPAAALLDVAADFAHLEVGYSFRHPWKPRLSLEYERASGDDGKTSFGRFDTLYGSRRADLAPSGLYQAVSRANIESPDVRIEAAPSARLDLAFDYRVMWLESATDSFSTSNLRDATGASGSYAGAQWEGRLRWWVAPNVLRLEINAILLEKGHFLKSAPKAPQSGDTHYLSVALQTNF